MKDNKSHQSGLRNASGCMYSHIVMFCSLVRLPGRRMCAQLIGTFYLITSYVLLSIKISSAVSGEQLASYLLVWTFELDFGSPLGCWARLIYPHHSVLISEPPLHAASKHWRLVSTDIILECCHTTYNNRLSEWKPNINGNARWWINNQLCTFYRFYIRCCIQTGTNEQ